MKKVGEINGYVRMTLVDKLSDIRIDLVRLDDDWQDKGFEQFLEALRKWTERSPIVFGASERVLKRDNMYYTKD